MRTLGVAAYHGMALLAMLGHVVIVGLFSLLLLYTSPFPIHAVLTAVLKVLIFGIWFGLFVLGVATWRERRWLVVVVPIVGFGLVWILGEIGMKQLGWSLGLGY